jgi:hypothetical protein
MLVASNRLWIGTGIGVVISVPLLDSKIYLFTLHKIKLFSFSLKFFSFYV